MLVEINKKLPSIRKKILKPFLINCNPNAVTLIALAMSGAAGYMFYINQAVWASVFVLLNGFFDILDGEIAKTYRKTTKLGDFLDHSLDRIADVFIFFGIALNPQVPLWIGTLTLVFILLVSYMGTQFQALTGKRLYGGIFGRSDRILFVSVFGFGTLFFEKSLYYGTLIVLALSAVTFLQRFYLSYKEIKKM